MPQHTSALFVHQTAKSPILWISTCTHMFHKPVWIQTCVTGCPFDETLKHKDAEPHQALPQSRRWW